MDENRSLWSALVADGIFPLIVTGLALCLSGGFALFLTFRAEFLPHDAHQIGFTAAELSLVSPNLVKFMLHDRAAFGGVLLAIGSIYMWLAYYPLANGRPWAWMAFAVSGLLGFGSFLLYIGYGYFDQWHGIATILLLPIFAIGLLQSRNRLSKPRRCCAFLPRWDSVDPRSPKSLPRCLLFVYAGGLILGGLVICIVGVTTIFVPQDLEFIQLCAADIREISRNLLGVIAHDRAGFGGGLLTTGVTLWIILANAELSLSFRQILTLSGLFGFVPAIGVHFYVGYTDFIHLLPAYIGATIFLIAMVLVWAQPGPPKTQRSALNPENPSPTTSHPTEQPSRPGPR